MEHPTSDLPDGHLRVTQAQRELALGVLRDAAADGRLEFAELEDRSGAALAARVRSDLAAVLDDLVPSAELPSLLGDTQRLGDGPGLTWDNPLTIAIHSWWRTERWGGSRAVPPFLEVNAGPGNVYLNLARATALAPIIDLVVVMGFASVLTVVVPEGWGVDTTGVVGDSYASLTTKVPTRPQRGLPRIILRGRSSGSITVRTAKESDLRKADALDAGASEDGRAELTAGPGEPPLA